MIAYDMIWDRPGAPDSGNAILYDKYIEAEYCVYIHYILRKEQLYIRLPLANLWKRKSLLLDTSDDNGK
jgi:hypothetical protein